MTEKSKKSNHHKTLGILFFYSVLHFIVICGPTEDKLKSHVTLALFSTDLRVNEAAEPRINKTMQVR